MAFQVIDESGQDAALNRALTPAVGAKKPKPAPPGEPIDPAVEDLAAQDYKDSLNKPGFTVINEGKDTPQNKGFKVIDEPTPAPTKLGPVSPNNTGKSTLPGGIQNALSYLPTWEGVKDALTPRTTFSDITSPGYWNQMALGTTGGAAVGMLGGPGGAATGGLVGALSSPLFYELQKREVEKHRARGLSPEDAQTAANISSTVLGLGTGMFGSPTIRPTQEDFVRTNTPSLPEPIQPGYSFTPENHPSLTPPSAQVIPTGKVVQGPVPKPSITDLARGTQATVPTSSQTGAFFDQPGTPPMNRLVPPYQERPAPMPSAVDLVSGKHALDLAKQETTSILEKPRFLRTAEEILQEKNRSVVRPAEEMIPQTMQPQLREQRYFKPAGAQGTSEAVAPLTKALQSKVRPQLTPEEVAAATQRRQQLNISLDKIMGDGLPTTPGPKEKAPGFAGRALASTWDELSLSGPLGQEASRIAVEDIDGMSERLASEWNVGKVDQLFTKWLGKRNALSRNNPFTRPSTGKTYNISREETDQLIDYLYTMSGKYGKVLYPTSPRLKGLADEFAKDVLPVVQNNPGVRQAVVNIPGRGKVPVGEAGGFYPHNPITPELKEGLSGRAFRLAYDQAKGRGFKGTELDFKDYISGKGEDQFRRFAGLELGRTLDATKGGTARPSQVLRELGYGTDPIQDFFHWSTGAYRRGQQILSEPRLVQIEQQLRAQWAGDEKSLNWIEGMMRRIRGNDMQFPDKFFGDWSAKANNLVNASVLQWSGPAQLNQATYIIGRYGLTDFFKGMYRLPMNLQSELMQKAGASMPYYLNMYTPNADIFGRTLQLELQLNGMSTLDTIGREVAAMSADSHLQRAMKYWNSFPNSGYMKQYVSSMLKEGHFTDSQIENILKTRQLSIDERAQFASHGANYTQGRTGYRGLPAYIADMNQSALGRSFTNIKKFAFSNLTEARRQLVGGYEAGVPAPVLAKRAIQLIGGAIGVGEINADLLYTLKNQSSFLDDERTPKWLRKAYGPVWGRIADDFAHGVGNIATSLLLSYQETFYDAVVNAIMPLSVVRGAKGMDALHKAVMEGKPDDLYRFLTRSTIGTAYPEKKPEGGGLGGGLMKK